MKIIIIFAGLFSALCLFGDTAADGKWVGTWVSAQQLVETHNLPPEPGLSGNTLRQIIQPSLGGERIRVTFSNLYGDGPLTIDAATVAQSKGGSAIAADSLCNLTFSGERKATIQPGASLISDPAQIQAKAFENLAVSVHCTAVPVKITGHPGSRTTSFVQKGDCVSLAAFEGAAATDHWYLLAVVDVWTDKTASAIVVIGDSITDGRGSTTNQNDRWPDNLARRLRANPRTANIAVLNQGIGGNRLLRNGLGPSALERFDRDALIPAGTRWLIVFEGINDIGTAVGARAHGEPGATAKDITASYEQMVIRAHTHGLHIYGATIMPFQGFASYYNPQSDEDRNAVNRWIRTKGNFDGVIDFDEIARDHENTSKLSSLVDGGDHLHPSANGYKLMADAIDLSLFTQ